MAARDRIESLPGIDPWTRPFDRSARTRAPRNSTPTPTPTNWMPRCRRRGGASDAISRPRSERGLEAGDLGPARADHHANDIEAALREHRSLEGEVGLRHPAKLALLAPVHAQRRIDVGGRPAGLHLHEDEAAPPPGDDVQLAEAQAPVAVEHRPALRHQQSGRGVLAGLLHVASGV